MMRVPPCDRALEILRGNRTAPPGIVPPHLVIGVSATVAGLVAPPWHLPAVAAGPLGVVSTRPVRIAVPAVRARRALRTLGAGRVLVTRPAVLGRRPWFLPRLEPAPCLSRPRVRLTPQVAQVPGTVAYGVPVLVRLASLLWSGRPIARAPSVTAADAVNPAPAPLVAGVTAAHVPPFSG